MQTVELSYLGLIARATGRRQERRELPPGATLGALLRDLERQYGEQVGELLFDDDRALLCNALVAVGGKAVRDLETPLPQDGSAVRILVMSPMMIGG
ncbi:MAG: MoaD/ThiS family protein [Burkholderiaceae bacterium]|nr:MoaD/ThiS family protein [Burkholderiaceae bacterium]